VFSGIIEEKGKVASGASSGKIKLTAKTVLKGSKTGDSIGVNGVCLTVTSLGDSYFTADVMPETLKRTNLGSLAVGDEVNLERALEYGGRIGGHLVQGHIDDTGRVVDIRQETGAVVMTFEAPAAIMCYIVEKGFVAVDGVSLTVSSVTGNRFSVSLVAITLESTRLGNLTNGDIVNIEVDMIAKYVEKLSQKRESRITEGFLKEHGFWEY